MPQRACAASTAQAPEAVHPHDLSFAGSLQHSGPVRPAIIESETNTTTRLHHAVGDSASQLLTCSQSRTRTVTGQRRGRCPGMRRRQRSKRRCVSHCPRA